VRASLRPASFRLLLKLFQNRFFENDAVSPGGGFQTSIYQVLGVLITLGLCVSYLVLPQFLALALRPVTPLTNWGFRVLWLGLAAYSFGVAGFAAVFYWDTLFPDRRDFLILAPFPIAVRELIGAKFLALIRFLFLLVLAINAAPNLLLLLAMFIPKIRGLGMHLAVAQLAVTWGASIFGFLAVAAFEGVLIAITSVRVFRRISPWIQMLGMSFMLLSILGFPFYSALFPLALLQHQLWFSLFPPVWFSGLYELILSGGNRLLVSLGVLSIKATAVTIAVLLLTWGLGFRRHFRRTLESEDAPHRPGSLNTPGWLVRAREERTIFGFIARTLARSPKHQFFLACYLSAGISVAAFFAAAIRDGKIALSEDGARSASFALGFFLISGFRAVFQFPAELGSNWIFRMTEARWTEVSRSATRRLVLAVSLVGLLVLALPLEVAVWKWPIVLEHSAAGLLAAALLIEALFWNFDKVPFTCSFFPGRTSLALLVVLYVYGITGYSFNMADVERAMERHAGLGLVFFPGAVFLLVLAWRRRPRAEAVRFDGSEPAIQTLDLN
jgi:hypothetical protein